MLNSPCLRLRPASCMSWDVAVCLSLSIWSCSMYTSGVEHCVLARK